MYKFKIRVNYIFYLTYNFKEISIHCIQSTNHTLQMRFCESFMKRDKQKRGLQKVSTTKADSTGISNRFSTQNTIVTLRLLLPQSGNYHFQYIFLCNFLGRIDKMYIFLEIVSFTLAAEDNAAIAKIPKTFENIFIFHFQILLKSIFFKQTLQLQICELHSLSDVCRLTEGILSRFALVSNMSLIGVALSGMV